jgi:hypothetical protein
VAVRVVAVAVRAVAAEAGAAVRAVAAEAAAAVAEAPRR